MKVYLTTVSYLQTQLGSAGGPGNFKLLSSNQGMALHMKNSINPLSLPISRCLE
jgi:hypothetical protein